MIMTEKGKKISKIIETVNSGQLSTTTFFDWVTMMALSLTNSSSILHSRQWQEREEWYLNIAKKYSAEDLEKFCECTALLMEGFEEKLWDYLGEIFHEISANNKQTGQFFTPFNLSMLSAKMAVDEERIKDGFEIQEPSCGSGGMIIATAQCVKDLGYDYMKMMRATCYDIDWNCVHMCYVQMSLAGIKAKVEQRDTLRMTGSGEKGIYYTPAWKMF